MALFHGMPHEPVTLLKKDGRRFEKLPAIVQSKMIFTEDATIPIEDGDQFERVTPSGVVETYTVLDAGFQQGFGGVMPSHYQSKVRKDTALPASPRQPETVYNLVGPNSRVNIQSTDSSTNVVTIETTALFNNIRQTIEQSSLDAATAQRLIERVSAMESSAGSKTFPQRYAEFMGVLADHVTLMTAVAPFLPALTQLLTNLT